MSRVLIALLFCAAVLKTIEPAKILGIYPMPSISHQVVYRALTLELIKQGHEVVVVTPDPAFKGKKPPANLTEIDISDLYKTMLDMLKSEEILEVLKRGVIMEWTSMTTLTAMMATSFNKGIFENSQVNALIEDKNRTFDLVIVESLTYSHLIFGQIFNAPVILFSSLYGTPTNFQIMGAVSRHPLLHPNVFKSKFRNQNLLVIIENLYQEYKLWKYDIDLEIMENDILINRFGANAPTIAELKKNVVLLFTNTHPIFDGNRPVPPGVVNLGALHLNPVKPLPQDLKSYLDNSTRGVIYVSMGTNVRPSEMEKDFLDAFLDAFEALPYDILWKFDGDSLETVPNNVKIQKWFPQRDLLGHPNIKAYVMQGGLQSTDEAIDAEVLLVGIPILADQWYNVNKYVELGIGLSIDSLTMTSTDLVKAVNTITNDPSFKENMKKLKALVQDQPEKPIDRAVWWTEHVLRHKGSRHLLGAAAQMSWREYLILDVLIPLALVLLIAAAVAIVAFYQIVKLVLFLNRSVKVKQN